MISNAYFQMLLVQQSIILSCSQLQEKWTRQLLSQQLFNSSCFLFSSYLNQSISNYFQNNYLLFENNSLQYSKMSKNSEKRFPSGRSNLHDYNQPTQSMLGPNSKLANTESNVTQNQRYDEINKNIPNSPHQCNNSQNEIARRIQMKMKTKKLSAEGNRRTSQKSHSNGYLAQLQSNSSIDKDKSTIQKESHKTFTISLESLSHKMEQLWQNSDKINDLVSKYSSKNNKLNLLRIKQLVWKDLSMVLCEYTKKVLQQQNFRYENSISPQIILEEIIISRINKVCYREQLNAKCETHQKAMQAMINKRIKQLETLKIR